MGRTVALRRTRRAKRSTTRKHKARATPSVTPQPAKKRAKFKVKLGKLLHRRK